MDHISWFTGQNPKRDINFDREFQEIDNTQSSGTIYDLIPRIPEGDP